MEFRQSEGVGLPFFRFTGILGAMSRGLVWFVWLFVVVNALAASDGSDVEFQGSGLCQFALQGFKLSPQSEAIINQSVEKLIAQHQAVLGFRREPGFRLRIRVFGRHEDFTNHPAARAMPNMQGIYSPATKEIVTWRQEIPGFLGTTLLHEASHAIMDAHYRRAPIWLEEGAAEYFAHSLYVRNDATTDFLRRRWASLNFWLRDGKLPPLPELLNASPRTWRRLDLEQAYAVSWSVFQFLMASETGKDVTRKMLAEWQVNRWERPDCAEEFNRLYPGGLGRLETGWHQWITRASAGERTTNVFRGQGFCQFALRGYELTPAMEAQLNRQVRDLAEEQRRAFGFAAVPDGAVRIRIFGQEAEFARFATNWMVSGFEMKSGDVTQTSGYYSPLSREIVIRGPASTEALMRVVLHLANTALLQEQWRYLPQWAREGSRQCFVAGPEVNKRPQATLAAAWRNAGLRDSDLARARTLLNDASAEWRSPAGAGEPTQVLCGAMLQFLVSSEPNRKLLRTALANLQSEHSAGSDSVVHIARLYPGGWGRFDADFKKWVNGVVGGGR